MITDEMAHTGLSTITTTIFTIIKRNVNLVLLNTQILMDSFDHPKYLQPISI
jgi:hypothetical protein